jgi:shikimate dehydrogenase
VKAAVLGSPIAHSLSPVLHNAAYTELGLAGWSYTAIECDEASLPELVSGCGPEWAGLSLTMPLKLAVLPLLDEVDELAADTGAANTVVFGADGRHGYNTDVAGMVAALAEIGVSVSSASSVSPVSPATSLSAGRSATILGAGGTARAALAALRDLGLAEAVVLVRDQSRAAGLLAAARRLDMAVDLRPYSDGLRDGDLLISTVPAGAADSWAEQALVHGSLPCAVLDVVYDPWPTVLAQAALKAGIPVASGLDLLLHQAARQVELMTGRPAPVEAMRAAVDHQLRN